MGGRRDLKQKVASIFELPGDVMLDVARISLIGDMELSVENHRGVLEYTTDRIVLQVPQGRLAVSGEAMTIASISPDQVIIVGKIGSVGYQTREGGQAGC